MSDQFEPAAEGAPAESTDPEYLRVKRAVLLIAVICAIGAFGQVSGWFR